jgi:uncharacterized protein involved in exopolysaccharide biosynthesis
MPHEEALEDEIDIRELFSVLWNAKIQILTSTMVAAVISIGYALSLPNIYQSSALLAPAEDSGGGIGGLLGQYSGLASMAGVSLPGGGDVSKAGLALEVIKSRAFAKTFISKHKILPELLAADHWDPKTRQLTFDPDLFDVKSMTWIREAVPPQTTTPSDQEAFEEIQEILSVNQDKTSNLVTISVKHRSPDVAKRWVDWLVEDVNEAMREKEVTEARESIEYLKRQAADTTLADLDQVFYELVQSQMQTMMLAQVRREYALVTIDPAISPELKTEPNRGLICILGVLLGGMLGVLISLVRYYSGNLSVKSSR